MSLKGDEMKIRISRSESDSSRSGFCDTALIWLRLVSRVLSGWMSSRIRRRKEREVVGKEIQQRKTICMGNIEEIIIIKYQLTFFM
jgi:hypothetical protein